MARNGSGTYNLPAGNPVVTGTTISSTTTNNTFNDIATALTGSLSADGQTTPTGNLPMGGYKHTNVADATVRTQYASAGQVQDSAFTFLTSPAGTNTITATASLGMSAYVTGQRFFFVAPAANTGAVTLNINAIGAKSVTKSGTTALLAGDIVSGSVVQVVYDGTQFQLLNPYSASVGPTTSLISSLSLTSNVVTINTASAHGILINDSVVVTAVTNTAVNGSFTVASVPTSTSFTYALTASNIAATVDTGTVLDNSFLNLTNNAKGILPLIHGGTGANSFTPNAAFVGGSTSTSAIGAVRPSVLGNLLTSTAGSTVTAGSFVIGNQYSILTIGTTDFTTIGASANTIGIAFVATGVGSGTGTAQVTTWASAAPVTGITATSGTAPYFGARAFASFSTSTYADISATYTQNNGSGGAGTTVILTVASHAYQVGHYIYVDITSGTAVDNLYIVTAVTPTTITYTASGSVLNTSGNATIKQCSIYTGSQNVANVVYQAIGTFILNFTTAMPFANYTAIGSAGSANGTVIAGADDNFIAFGNSGYNGIRTTQSIRGFSFQPSGSPENGTLTSVTIFA
jgi:hypothetical protein